MSDNNDFNNNMNKADDDFFAKFDDMAETHKNKVPADSGEFFYGSSKDYRNVKATRSRRNKSADGSAKPAHNREKLSATARLEKIYDKAEAKTKQHKPKGKVGKATASFMNSGPKYAANRESKKRGVLKFIFLAGLCLVMAIGLFVGVAFMKAPLIDTDNIYSMISQRSVMYDTDKNEIENLYYDDGNRSIVKYKDIPEDMVNAVIAIEDQKFKTHNGFNFIRMIGAIKDSVFNGGHISGTSTITQQLARNVYLSEIKSQRSLSRKITEMYCTIVLEKKLSKEQIMEAYLNTIYLGFNSYGVEAAAQSYYNKSVSELDLVECASLAALPKSPDTYALIYADYYNVKPDLPVIKKSDNVNYRYNGDMSKDRRDLTLKNMCSRGDISEAERDKALAVDLKDRVKVGSSADSSESSYFTDYAITQLTADIMEEYNISEADAKAMIYTGGLKIYTTMDSNIQNIMEEEFAETSNFSSVAYTRTNSDGDMINEGGRILAYSYDNMFDDNDNFVLKSDEFKKNSDGGITIRKGNRLNLYSIEVNGAPDVSVEFKGMFKKEDGVFYFIESGALAIPQGYKELDNDGNCVISGQFFTDYPEFFKKSGDDYVVADTNYTLKQKVRQPQAAAVIMENETGEIKGMMGGRGITGKQLYNRAIHPRQPGSSIKPLAIYGPALQMSFEYEAAGKTMNLDTSEGSDWGDYITAGSIINDAATKDGNGKVWPKNVYNGYKGDMTLRQAVQQSVNVCSYKTYLQIDRNEGASYSIDMLEKVGITTIDPSADANPAALALGGLTKGIAPLEETAAYATFPNGGVFKTPIFYTKVFDSSGNLIYEKKTEETQVYDPGVAWIITDVLRTVVSSGGGHNASIGTQPVGGKTGTTSDKYDIWFSGFTPYYTMSLWMGNDINMDLVDSSPKAAAFWSHIMRRVHEGLPRASFFDKPANVESKGGEYYTTGTYSKVKKDNDDESSESSSTDPSETVPSQSTSPATDPTSPPPPTDPPTSPPTDPPTSPPTDSPATE